MIHSVNVQTVIYMYVHNLVLYFICIFLNIVSAYCDILLLFFILMFVEVQALKGLCYQFMLFDNK